MEFMEPSNEQPRKGSEGIRYTCTAVPKVASRMIRDGMEEGVLRIGDTTYEYRIVGVDQNFSAPVYFLPHSESLTLPPHPNPTLLVITLGGLSRGAKAMFNAETGELVGPSSVRLETASQFGEALESLTIDRPEDQEVLEGSAIRNYAKKKDFIRSWVPDFFEKFGERANSNLFMKRLDELFPLPAEFEPFQVLVVASDPRYWIKIEKTSDMMYALKQVWTHYRHVNLDQVYGTLRNIDPELESAVRIAFERTFTQHQAEKYRAL